MDDTTRGLGRESMSGRGEDSLRDYANPPAVQPDSDEDTNRRTQEIRAEIEHTREEMSETIEAIQERLQPGNIVAGATERVRAAATEKVRNMADSASETARNAMERTREMTGDFAEIGRQNTIPAAMIGVGVAWLLIDRFREGQSHRSWDRWNRDRGSYRYGGAENDSSDRYYRAGRQRVVGYLGSAGVGCSRCRSRGPQDGAPGAEPAPASDAGEPADGWRGRSGYRRRRGDGASRNRA